MKNIFSIFNNDIKKIATNIIAFIIIIGLTILPALYAWFNIAANWDPYSNTGGLSVAVCNLDEGYDVKTISINCGGEIVTNLKQNTQMGWTFVDAEDEALSGVANGKYYAAVVIPSDFTEKLCSIITGELNQSEIKYYVNEKKNAIAPKITDKGVQTIQQEVDASFVSTITKTIATTLNITTDEVADKKTEVFDNINSSLSEVQQSIETFKSTITVLNSTLDTIENLVKTNQAILPDVDNLLAQSGTITTSTKDAIETTRNSSKQLTDTVGNILASTQSLESDISSQVNDAFSTLSSDAGAAANKLQGVTSINKKIIDINSKIISILENLSNTFGVDNSKLIDLLENANSKQRQSIEKIDAAANTIKTNGSLPLEQQQEITGLINESNSQIESLQPAFTSAKSAIDAAVDSVYSTLEKASGLMKTIDGDLPSVNNTLESACTTLSSMKTSFNNISDLLYNASVDIDVTKNKIKKLSENATIENFVDTILKDPDRLGEFVASPVTINTESMYPVKNYGSSMTPFYSTLAFWVGGIVLVAVLKVDLSKKDLRRLNRKVNSTQQFFGRYLLFMLLGLVQATIIALGDIFFLQIQCDNILLFLIASWVSSLVYTLLIYSLTITFSVIGKALAVILLVIQIAGSGGTFPVEVLPPFFQGLYPFMPFKYGINALREAVAGPYQNDFWYDILYLLAFIPVALLLGLLLRKPCIRIIAFFNKRVEESDLMV
ncbi:MAG TPA: YhgE/Pip domain-containing protein [Clostridiales bacterium]|nr:YhgE/Pip domain-containing protein [Clostridiales bacterium]